MSGGGDGWAESQTRSMASQAGWLRPQSPDASADEVYSLLNPEHAPSAFARAEPAFQGGMGAGTQQSGVQVGEGSGGRAGSLAPTTTGVAASGSAAHAEAASTRPSVEELGIENKINQEKFDAVADAVGERRMSVRRALERVGLSELSAQTMRRWLLKGGRPITHPRGRRNPNRSLSEAQILTASLAHSNYIDRTGSSVGSVSN